MAELGTFLAPVTGDNPSGVDLRNDDRFHALERMARPDITVERDDQNNPSGQTASAVDWGAVLDEAMALAEAGRDLRLLVIVTRALANIDGYQGLADGLKLIADSADQYWDNLHPALRQAATPKDGALRRTNALLQLENDDDGLLGDLGRNVAFSPRGLGPVTGKQLSLAMLDQNTVLREAAGGLNEKERAALVAEHEALVTRVKTACRAHADQEAEAMAALSAEVAAARAALSGLEAVLAGKLGGNGAGVKFAELGQFLDRVAATLSAVEPAAATPAGDTQPAPEAVTNVTAEAQSGGIASAPSASGGGTIPDRLTSRKDVERCLDLIIDFYERTEPSSPLPLMAKRLRRMVPMDFMDLMAELAPSGLKEFRAQAGATDDKKRDG